MEREKCGIIVILLRGEIKINREKGGFFTILGEWKNRDYGKGENRDYLRNEKRRICSAILNKKTR